MAHRLSFVLFFFPLTVPGFFIPGFPKLQRFQAHHELILSKMLPKLKKHLVSTSVHEKDIKRFIWVISHHRSFTKVAKGHQFRILL